MSRTVALRQTKWKEMPLLRAWINDFFKTEIIDILAAGGILK